MNKNFGIETKEGLSLLLCKPLVEAGIRHAFTTREGGVTPGKRGALNLGYSRGDDPHNVDENYRRLARALGIEVSDIHGNRQVHDTLVRAVEKGEDSLLSKAPMPEADGLITDVKGTALAAYYADCVPILLAHPKTGTVSAVHAGWRGTAKGILLRAVEAFETRYRVPANELIAAIGPSICASCYPVGDEVEAAFAAQFGADQKSVIRKVEGKPHADLWEANRLLLLRAGLRSQNVYVSEVCTRENEEIYFSHRVAGDERGVLAAVIVGGRS